MKRKRNYQPISAISAIAARKRAHQQASTSQPQDSENVSSKDASHKQNKARSGIEVVIRTRKESAVVSLPAVIPNSQASTANEQSDDGSIAENNVESDSGHSRRSDNVEIRTGENHENFRLSKGVLTKKDIISKTNNSLCIHLRENTAITILGQYDLWVKRGVVSILGAKLPPSPQVYRVYAPSTHSLPVIKPIGGDSAEVEISSCRSGLPLLRRVSDLHRRIWCSSDSSSGNSLTQGGLMSFSILHSSSDDPLKRHLRPLHLDRHWSLSIKALSNRGSGLRVMTCGPKGSGKSTFNKYLFNHLLSVAPTRNGVRPVHDGVAYLDLDPGQPEFSPPGQVYLAHIRRPILGPSFSHPNLLSENDGTIMRAHHIGATSPKDDPEHFEQCVMDLLHRYEIHLQTYPRCPLVINYPGWIFGRGLEVAISLVQSLGLSDLVYMSVQGPEEVIEPLQAAAAEVYVPVTTLPSQPTEYATRSSHQLRAMQMLSYFHMQPNPKDLPIWSDLPISQHRSFNVSYSGEHQGIHGIMVAGFYHDPTHLPNLLEGSIVGVVALESLDSLSSLGHSGHPGHVTVATANTTEAPDGTLSESAANHCRPDQDLAMSNTDPPAASSSSDQPKNPTPHDNLPYLFVGNGTCILPNPSSSYCLGLALVRSIDTQSQTIQLTTPIAPRALRNVLETGHHIVLVRGTLDNPNWALSEEYFAAKTALRAHRRQKPRFRTDLDDMQARIAYAEKSRRLAERVRRAAEGVPWVKTGRRGEQQQQRKEVRRDGGAALWKLKKFAPAVESDRESE
ncbi:Polynucleotide 5'-hydroxyl-kinase grc3 [Ophidiomyces ophidiicola]|uniref:Polynucleotide 5'-hydroxyl-kinase grc3 n=1 Tax=Ophidiomyces ophidiicola TaxID=1387563 RepID=A0ACB8UPV8_9EURO|nr:Polynucleotide 5'-hydroxyl-kinase grc3 [Ophidiomyces ophidiicola]KAI1909147.1 Polynucleotide 5'-hydroxyl-kinase grc3 [Ophidiomyces ophidiicola]KAI1911414.1 Polynucleotide 5'-hydroxyl-kinase grc3 [Ophidiomyces ophidiicola]KAI1930968.1 Polynucleotide 5'-hydroxyl-kinase grc3 [Ophidiomyces ophidiicola]KAI1939314.1 Polynucleotide 5'-hydroxyl-kinase grc3 [Ophidiomyces ophidiicola]KAI1946720.1 Polynucleotide 5'-hydroxyl-kinase grc3 [Ophidiomyces ophidiicola]